MCLNFCSSFSIHVVIKQLCRFYQMMRKDLYMIALVRQVYKENTEGQTVVQQGYDPDLVYFFPLCQIFKYIAVHFGNQHAHILSFIFLLLPFFIYYNLDISSIIPVLSNLLSKICRWILLKFLIHFLEDRMGFLEAWVNQEASILIWETTVTRVLTFGNYLSVWPPLTRVNRVFFFCVR